MHGEICMHSKSATKWDLQYVLWQHSQCSKLRETANGKNKAPQVLPGTCAHCTASNLALATFRSCSNLTLHNRIEQVQLNSLQTSNWSLACFPLCLSHAVTHSGVQKIQRYATAQEHILLGHRHHNFFQVYVNLGRHGQPPWLLSEIRFVELPEGFVKRAKSCDGIDKINSLDTQVPCSHWEHKPGAAISQSACAAKIPFFKI